MFRILAFKSRTDIEAALTGPEARSLREEIGQWVDFLLSTENLVPDTYGNWRPLVRDSFKFLFSSLSPARLAEKVAEQLELPVETPPESRLLRLIRKMPGLQKLGQVLARNRYLDPALRKELASLENGIRDVEFSEINSLIENELGEKLAEDEIKIEPGIFSEASVSAVVRFSYPGGRGVFKVLKPHIPDCFAEDMALLQQLADFVASGKHDYGFSSESASETFTEIRRLLEHEVDFLREQANMARGAQAFGHFQSVRVPELMPSLCTRRITAMSEEDGVKATEAPLDPDRQRTLSEHLVEALVISPLFSASRDSLFHADPHAGNLLYDARSDQLVILDWALTGNLNQDQKRQFCMLLMMLGLRDAEGISSAISKLSPGQIPDIRIIRNFLKSVPAFRTPGSLDAVRLLDCLALGGVRFPADLLMFRKVLFTLDGVLNDIAGTAINLDSIIANYLAWHWAANLGKLTLPLRAEDWADVLSSSFLYGNRMWLEMSGL
jgi:ubiquinone biosynthesis protein